jgi:hypothetical protein
MNRRKILRGGVIFLLLLLIGFSVSEKQKEQAEFCVGCHAKNLHQQKYKTFRSVPPVNLAGIHNGKACVFCHRGTTVEEKIALHGKEIWNLLCYFSRNFEEPRKISWPWVDGACAECHRKLKADGLFHGAMAHEGKKFPVRCTECHQSHPEGRKREKYFLSREILRERCDSCHRNYDKIKKYLDTFSKEAL